MKEGQIFIEGLITPQTTDEVKRQLALNANAESFAVHISSPGGSVYDGYKIFHAIKQAAQNVTGKAKPIRAIIEGEAQSMATFIACVADKGMVEIADPSRYMIHNPSIGVESDAAGLREGAEELTMIEGEMAAAYSARTGLPLDQIKIMMAKETKMTAQEAVKLGFADKISTHLRAVAVGKTMKHEQKVNIFKQIGDLFKQAAAEGPSAYDVPLQDGTVLQCDAADETTLVGSNATLNGQPAPDGDYPAADGTLISVAGGKITAVTPAAAAIDKQIAELQQKKAGIKPAVPVPTPAPTPAPIQTAEQKLAAAEAELAKMKSEKDKAEADKVKAEQEKEATAQTIAKVEKEFEALKLKTVGDSTSPAERAIKIGAPVGYMPSAVDMRAVYASRTYLADNMRWLESKYKGGKYADGTTFDSYRTGGPNAVSILEVNFNYTWNGILTTDIFFKPTINTPALSDLVTVDPGTKDKKVYNLITPISKVLLPYTGCTSTPNTNRVFITNKTIQVKEFRMYEGWCKDDFTGQLGGLYNFLAQEWLKTGEASFDPAGTPIDRIIVQILKEALKRDVFRRAFFADADSTDPDYNQFNAFWPSLIDQSGASNYCVYRYGAALGTGTLAANTAATYFAGMYNGSSLLLKQEYIDSGMAKFLVTRSVWENYYDSVVAVGSVSNDEYNNYLQGIKQLNFRGVPVIPITMWDSLLAESDNPMTATSRHLIALTPKENHILGVEDVGDMTKIDSWYEMKDSKRYYRADMKMGFLGPLHCDLTTISY